MAIKALRVLVQFDFPSGTFRIWDGSGPYIDGDGHVWRGAGNLPNLDAVESALNAEAAMLEISLSGVDPTTADIAWAETEAGDVIGSTVRILIQPCDESDQPVGSANVRLTAAVDNIRFDDAVAGDEATSTVTVECTNRFNLRNLVSGSVLSDVDQRARSAVLNPGAPGDRFAERVPLLADHTIHWPNWG